MLRKLTHLGLGLLIVAAAPSCGDDDAPTTTTVTDTGVNNNDTGGLVNECAESEYIDATTDETKRKVTPWGLDLGKNGCVMIKAGQSVTWDPAPDALHPLEPFGGDAPNPITNTATIAFPSAGTFGFHCSNHPTIMFGAIRVVP